jgi:CRISPR-associated protein Csx17
MNTIILEGCTPEPLMSYLKALGILRIIAEQKDPDARGCWRDGAFIIDSELTQEELTNFFLSKYKPTPVIVPWSGEHFFKVSPNATFVPTNKTPTASKIIESFLSTSSDRLSEYRIALNCALTSLTICGISNKSDMENKELKRCYISALRNVSLESVTDWIDTCAVLTAEKASFSTLLGSGGGSDGHTHFSDNFMQNLWEVLPEFESQRKKPKGSSQALIENALWGINTSELVPNRTSSLYDAGASGGANAGQGFERNSLTNPWNFILCLEGTLLFAGAISRRQTGSEKGRAAFPFQVRLTTTNLDSSSKKETSGREIWLPIWERWATHSEIATLFTEGRVSIGSKSAERGVDIARAAASLGIDRGIKSFQRYAIVKGRIGGENYNTSAYMGSFDVNDRTGVNLLCEIDPWLDRFRQKTTEDKTPPRFKSALRKIETAIFSFCQYGGHSRFADILCALGQAEKELANGENFRKDKYLRPLAGLSPEWIEAAYDASPEFEIALSLAGIYDASHKIGALRANLEPVKTVEKGKRIIRIPWSEGGREVVWNSSSLIGNLAAVLERRLIDGERAGCDRLPLACRRTASRNAIAAFIAGEIDDRRVEELLWGMLLINHYKDYPILKRSPIDAPPLPRSYALLKLLFMPGPLTKQNETVEVRPEMAILPLLRAKRVDDACQVALRRLRASGFIPQAKQTSQQWHTPDSARIAAALLIPVASRDVEYLKSMVLRPETNNQAVAR